MNADGTAKSVQQYPIPRQLRVYSPLLRMNHGYVHRTIDIPTQPPSVSGDAIPIILELDIETGTRAPQSERTHLSFIHCVVSAMPANTITSFRISIRNNTFERNLFSLNA